MRKVLAALALSLVAVSSFAVPKVAVLNPTLDEDIDQKVGQIIVDKILEEMLRSKNYNILDRASRDVIWQERNFQLSSGEIDTAQIKEIGKGLGADYIVTAKMIHLGSIYVMTAQLIDVQTLEVLKAASSQAPDRPENAISLSSECGAQLAGAKKPASKAPAAKPAASAKGAAASKGAKASMALFDPSPRSIRIAAGGWWYPTSDENMGGNSRATIDNGRLAAGALRFDYQIGTKREYPFAILAAGLDKSTDLSAFSAVEVTYRGRGAFRLEIAMDEVKDYNWYGAPLKAESENWQTARIPFSSMVQGDWSPTKVPFSLAHIHAVQFAVQVLTKPDSGWLEILSMSLVE